MSDYPVIVPYLAVAHAAAAIDLYKTAFGAEEKMRVAGAKRGIMHAEVLINGGLVMLTDSAPEVGFPAPKPDDQVPVGIMVCWDKPADVDAIYARAVAAGARPRRRRGTSLGARATPPSATLRAALVAARGSYTRLS